MGIASKAKSFASMVWLFLSPLEAYRTMAPFLMCIFGGLIFAAAVGVGTAKGLIVGGLFGGMFFAFALDLHGQRKWAGGYSKGVADMLATVAEADALDVYFHDGPGKNGALT